MSKTYLEELSELRRRFNALLEQALLRGGYEAEGETVPGTWTPAVDLVETESTFLLFAELPGVDREDIDLTVEPRRVSLSGRRRPLGDEHRFLRLEGSHGPFHRDLELTQAVDPDAVSAVLEDGLLRITLPKRSAAAGKRAGGRASGVPITDGEAVGEEGKP